MAPSPFAATLKDSGLFVEQAFINGQWVSSKSQKTFEVWNPASEALIGCCPECTTDDVHDAIQAASAAFQPWRSLTGRQRGRILCRVYDYMVDSKEDLRRIITAENGKAHVDAGGEAFFAASFFEWFGEEAPRVYGDVIPHSSATSRVHVIKQPVGVCGLITPWNFPLAMGARKIAAALAAGCTVVVKSDGLTPFSLNALAVLCERAGVPNGALNIVPALKNTPQLGLALCESPTVKKISFTGSTRVGRLLMQQSSHTLKKLSLELGGNAPFIVFDDADVDVAVSSALVSKFRVSGQTCVCANRIFVQNGIYNRFAEKLVEEVKKFRFGNALDDDMITHGPLTNGTAKVEELVADAVAKKAKILVGGNRLPSLGDNFYEATVLGDANDSMRVSGEEIFGPIAALARFSTEDEVVSRANQCDVGLASYIMTNDLSRSYRVSERLETGMVGINIGVVSDATAP